MSASGKQTRRQTKAGLLGKKPGVAAPAWRDQQRKVSAAASGSGPANVKSKILLSNLPKDVEIGEVEELFSKTVGPVAELFLVYNNQAKSKGMAIVGFSRPQDAVAAKARYDGKIVDGRAPLRIELIVDNASSIPTGPRQMQVPSLMARLGPPPLTQRVTPLQTANGSGPTGKKGKGKAQNQHAAPGAAPVNGAASVVPPTKKRTKKGPKRVKKVTTVQDLDQDMDTYRAAVLVPTAV